MKIFVINSKNKRILIDVEASDSIKKIKDIIRDRFELNTGEITLHFNGEILEDEGTLDDYGIEEESSIILMGTFRGGEFGGSSKLFADPTKVSPKELIISNYGPSYRTVNIGMNLFGICKNKKCQS